MSQRKSAMRQQLIVRKFQNSKRATFDEINDYLERRSEIIGDDFTLSKRTFDRDRDVIRELHNVNIEYHFSGRYYYVVDEEDAEINERFLEALDVYNALKINDQNKNYLYFEKRKAAGTEHLFGLLHAIKNCLQISIAYQPFYYDTPTQRTLEPLALKEFKHRWYLFAREVHEGQVKTYALDRITDLEISKKKFQKDPNFDLDQMMKHTFGISTPRDEKPQNVVLSFEAFQGNYIKSLPLHETQKILIDNDKELRVSLSVYTTFDFQMELLSHGDRVKILEPKRLVKEMKETCRKMLERYN